MAVFSLFLYLCVSLSFFPVSLCFLSSVICVLFVGLFSWLQLLPMRWREVSLLFALSLLSYCPSFILSYFSFCPLAFSMPPWSVTFFQNCKVVLALCVLAWLFPIMTSRSSQCSESVFQVKKKKILTAKMGGKKLTSNENKHEKRKWCMNKKHIFIYCSCKKVTRYNLSLKTVNGQVLLTSKLKTEHV